MLQASRKGAKAPRYWLLTPHAFAPWRLRVRLFSRRALIVEALIYILVPLALAGCGPRAPAGPQTVPVNGRVEVTKGSTIKDLANRSFGVEFQSVEKPEIKAFGAILEDGSFTLTTQVDSTGKPGAVPGAHRVRLNADESNARFVNPKFLEFETSGITVKVPSESEVVIKVWR